MLAPLLFTKLYVPPARSKVVLRPRLIEQLNKGLSLECRLVLISAPAGFGKTTLVSEWVAGCEQPVAWLSLDEGDNDPARFLTYLIAALQTITKDFGKGVLGTIQPPQPQTIINEVVLVTLLNEISAIPNHFILVLDDYHVIDSQAIDQALTFLLDHLPSQMRLVITTREDPSLPLPRYRIRCQLTELRAADLRFTPDEAGAFLNQMMNFNLSMEDIAALETRTEGWIAGLQMAALSMQGRENIAGFIQAFTGSHRFVLDYLVEEVLQRQPEPVLSFLLQTAILERFCASLCNAVTQREDGKEMLNVLEQNNLFLIPLDDQRHWYRYHHLFSDVLKSRGLESQPAQAARLHRRASDWCESNGLRPDAIRYALAAQDFARAADLLELAWPAAEEGSIPGSAWLGWARALPDALVRLRPLLNVCVAYAILGSGELEAAETRLREADALLQTPGPALAVADPDQYRSLPAAIAIGRAYIAQALGNSLETVRFASRVLALPEAAPYRHSQAAMLLGMAHWANGDLQAAGQVFAEFSLKWRLEGNFPDAISNSVVLAEIRLAQGRLREAINTLEELWQYLTGLAEPIPPDAADLQRELSGLYLEQGDLQAAAHLLNSSKELGKKAELPVWPYRWWIAQARLLETQGDMEGALGMLAEAERLHIRTPLPDFHPISALKARIWAANGRLTQALEWVRAQGLSPEDELSYQSEREHLTLARIQLAQYQADHKNESIQLAVRLLERLLRAAEAGGRQGSQVEILILQALAYHAQGDHRSALPALERALALAEPEGYCRSFLIEGRPMTELLEKFSTPEISLRLRRFSLKLLALTATLPQNPPPGSAPLSPVQPAPLAGPAAGRQALIESLSERELEVLRLLRSDLNGPEIARELVISLSTLRTHTQNIYAKLGVNNRRAAVRRAEELHLL